MKDKEYAETLIGRYLNGICTQEEQEDLKAWIEESTDKKAEFFYLKDLWGFSKYSQRQNCRTTCPFLQKSIHKK